MKSNVLNQHNLTGQHYGYSATDLTDLGATEYTLVTLVVDESGSIYPFKKEMEDCIKEIIKACKYSPRSDYLLVRLISFNSKMREIHGFKQLINCNIADYDDCLNPGDTTLLFETTMNAILATENYGKTLAGNDFDANAIIFVITDGMDNQSGDTNASKVGETLKRIVRSEELESISSILVGVGVEEFDDVSDYLNDFKNDAGLNQYIEIKNANEKTLAKLADFISKSISSQSNSLGTGGASQQLQF